MPESLTLKSATPNSSSQTSANAVLCTDNQTYQVRQVQSSNSVYVLQPSETSPEDGFIPTIGLSAIAQCTATLELIPEPASAIPFLKQTVPVYSGPEGGTQSPTASAPLEKKNRHAILERAPLSLGEFNKACEELCVFEVDGQAWLPTASMLANVWKSIISGATVRSINLGGSFSIATLSRIVEEDGHLTALFRAVMDRLSSNDVDLMDDCKLVLTESAPSASLTEFVDAALSREKAVPWVGLVLLQSHRTSTEVVLLGLEKPRYDGRIEGILPQSCTRKKFAKRQQGKYSQPGNGRIVFDESGGSAIASSTPAKSGGINARKWHEKFKNARR
ncbi:hypothetical protein OEA41_001577 [Lepraria neglecta]|uniref:Uncharacterized protein n=1 Tax=Lepraria neglecta TaxID=209136 RepID=A0AAE0DP55_9LECA|nr:hypothetical protein OEA41_001577 [Lepraria neglecta]